MGKAGVARGMELDCRCQRIVQLARQRHAVRTVDEIGAGPGSRQHLHRDAVLVHRLQAGGAELGQQVERAHPAGQNGARTKATFRQRLGADAAGQCWHRKMLFKCDNSHGWLALLIGVLMGGSRVGGNVAPEPAWRQAGTSAITTARDGWRRTRP